MDMSKMLEESLDGMWQNGQYGGNSEPPRKDFAPASNRAGYGRTSPAGKMAGMPPLPAGPSNPSQLAWPLETITYDLADSFVYLLAAANKLETCTRLNASINPTQRKQLKHLTVMATKILGDIKDLDAKVNYVANIVKDLPPLNPQQEK